MNEKKLALVGATGVVGRKVLNVLEEKNIPIEEIKLFASEKSEGKYIKFNGNLYRINELKENTFDERFDYAIFTAGSKVAEKYAPKAAKNGCIVIDNSSFFRMNEDVPLIIPEVNLGDVWLNNGIIANPNCSTIQALVAIAPINKKYKIKRIVYTTYQAVSGAGKNGIEDLKNGKNVNYKLKKFDKPIYNNCIPQIDIFENDLYTKEEHKMINETKKILHDRTIKITATTVRVPVYNCHCESINIEFEDEINVNEIEKILKKSEGIQYFDGIKYPINQDANNQDKVLVGRLRRDYSVSNGINIWVVADNIRKGAASNAVQILEKII